MCTTVQTLDQFPQVRDRVLFYNFVPLQGASFDCLHGQTRIQQNPSHYDLYIYYTNDVMKHIYVIKHKWV